VDCASRTALRNNFVIAAAGFDGPEIGWLQTIREILADQGWLTDTVPRDYLGF
jgi:hypothetical protein